MRLLKYHILVLSNQVKRSHKRTLEQIYGHPVSANIRLWLEQHGVRP